MATFRVRPVTLLEQQPDYGDLGRTLPIGASQTFPAYTIGQVNGSGQVIAAPNNANTNLGYIFEPATDQWYQAEGVGNSQTKTQVRLGHLKGLRIGITVQGTWNSSLIGAKRPIQTHSSGYATLNATASGTSTENIATILAVYDDQLGVANGDVNVYVEAILDDSACYSL